MVCDRCNYYFSFWVIFCSFTPLAAQKIKILKKWKKHLEILSFYICVPKIMIRRCTVPHIWCATDGWTDEQMDGHDRYRRAPCLKTVPLLCDINIPLHRWEIILGLTYVLLTLSWDWWYQGNKPCQRQVYSYSWKMLKLLRKESKNFFREMIMKWKLYILKTAVVMITNFGNKKH